MYCNSSISGSSDSDNNENICYQCHSFIKNLPIRNNCKECGIPICTNCGCYTSNFDIYCHNHIAKIIKKSRKIANGHYYSPYLKYDFFTNKNFRV